ncbi:hypothetical protein BDB00DRAFT_851557 [Zychaea mexicana]|uniref:uncharacterized protein n=1 Tax=Zychaea mexicana TaxID=64656 RepID=UPI0022FE59EB|nr:uncharacterized protein BDB00DRAFT_851557 [Zychaea mexicana]KAI9485111.1 hypothetical protein BDB00DRAFT_851557 [Zychaea mexicana]
MARKRHGCSLSVILCKLRQQLGQTNIMHRTSFFLTNILLFRYPAAPLNRLENDGATTIFNGDCKQLLLWCTVSSVDNDTQNFNSTDISALKWVYYTVLCNKFCSLDFAEWRGVLVSKNIEKIKHIQSSASSQWKTDRANKDNRPTLFVIIDADTHKQDPYSTNFRWKVIF